MPYGGPGGYGTGSTSRDSGGGGYSFQERERQEAQRRQQMGKKSKPPAMPAQTSAMEQAKASDWLAQQEFNRTQQTQAAAAAKAEAEKQAGIARTTGEKSRLYGEGQGYGTSQAAGLGYADTYGILDRYNASLNAARGRVPESTTDVGSYFNTVTCGVQPRTRLRQQSGHVSAMRTVA